VPQRAAGMRPGPICAACKCHRAELRSAGPRLCSPVPSARQRPEL